jgi:hypothetical protein
MRLPLQRLPPTLRWYRHPLPVPRSYRLLAPDAADALLAIEAKQPLCYTDIFRTPELSLWARQQPGKRGVQPPGKSAHNFGLAIDLDVEGTLKLHGWTYTELVNVMRAGGFFPHRPDGSRGHEEWHANYLGTDPGRYLALQVPRLPHTWERAAEQQMLDLFGDAWLKPDARATQAALARLKLYGGEIDGDLGPRSAQALAAFRRTWGLATPARGVTALDVETLRVLAVAAAELDIVELAA